MAHLDTSLTLGSQISSRRLELGITQSRLAALAGIRQPSISQIERGLVNPTLPLLFYIASALEWSLSELFDGVTSAVGVGYGND